MEIRVPPELRVGWTCTKIRPPAWSASIAVKLTAPLLGSLAGKPPPVTGDVFLDDDPEKPLLYSSDLVPFKPRADVLLSGRAHAAGGKATDVVAVAFGIGAWSKKLVVLGRGQPFVELPITYERAYGGAGFKRNPLGRPVAQIVRPDDLGSESPEVAGFGPIPLTWPQRMSKAGTYGKKWQRERWPWYAEDMDWTFWNAAPEDQQLPYLRGDEEIWFENLHPKHPRLSSRLPGLRVRCFLHEAFQGDMRFREVPMNLDTLTAEPDKEIAHLVWRGVAEVQSEKLKEIARLIVVAEKLTEPAKPVDHYRRELEAGIAARDAEPVEMAPASPSIPAAPAPTLEKFAGVDLTGADFAGRDLSQTDFSKSILKGANFSGAKLSRANFTGANLAGAEFAGADLCEAVLRQADLEGAGLERANLRKAVLEKADLSKARLARANLAGAVAGGAKLEFADLTGAQLSGIRLNQARLADARVTDADFSKADLEAAQLLRIWGWGVTFEEANLTNARFNHAFLSGANFRNTTGPRSYWEFARLQAADFSGGSFLRAEFSNAFLNQARFTKASLKHARLCETSLRRAHLDGADLFQASVENADLSEADCRFANFFEAEFLGARTERTLLQSANLKRTKLA